MTDDNDNTTKLIVLIAGLSTIAFFAYLAYRDHVKQNFPPQLAMMRSPKSTAIEKIEQRLIQLESKIDGLSANSKQIQQLQQTQLMQPQQTQQPQQPQQERTVVSMSKPRQQTNAVAKMRSNSIKEMFGMR